MSVPGQLGRPGLRHSIGAGPLVALRRGHALAVNGAVFYLLAFTTGHWRRLVPTSWDYIPSAASVALQYLSLDWPLVDNPVTLDLTQLRALPHHEQITQHFGIQGWSGIAKWGGVSLQTIIDLVKPAPEAKWVVGGGYGGYNQDHEFFGYRQSI